MTEQEKSLTRVAVIAISAKYKSNSDTLKNLWEHGKEITKKRNDERGRGETEIQILLRSYEAFLCSLAETLVDKMEHDKDIVVTSDPEKRRDLINKLANSPFIIGCTCHMVANIITAAEPLFNELKEEPKSDKE